MFENGQENFWIERLKLDAWKCCRPLCECRARLPAALLVLRGALFVPRCGILSPLICGLLQPLRCLRTSAATHQVSLQVLRLHCNLRFSGCLHVAVLKFARLDVVCAIDAIVLLLLCLVQLHREIYAFLRRASVEISALLCGCTSI